MKYIKLERSFLRLDGLFVILLLQTGEIKAFRGIKMSIFYSMQRLFTGSCQLLKILCVNI